MADIVGQTKVYALQKAMDPRLVQVEELYTVLMGADAVQQMEQSVQTPSTASMTWNFVPPSPGAVIMRSPVTDIVILFKFYVQQTSACQIGSPLDMYGRDWAFAAAAPFARMVSNWNIQINGANCTFNNLVLLDLVHVLDTSAEHANRACNWRTPVYTTWDEADGTTNALGSMAGITMDGDAPPGSYEVTWYMPSNGGQGGNGTGFVPVPANGWVQYTAEGLTVTCFNGYPIATPQTLSGYLPVQGTPPNVFQPGTASYGPYTNYALIPLWVSMRFQDTVVCPPFNVNYMHSFEQVGMHGLSNIAFTAQLTTPAAARLIQGCAQHGVILAGPNALLWSSQLDAINVWHSYVDAYQSGASGSYAPAIQALIKSTLRFTALSPPINAELNPTNILPMVQITYYPQTIPVTIAGFNLGDPLPVVNVSFNAVTFPAVPDIIMMSQRPSWLSQTPNETDWQWTLTDAGVVQCNFANNPAVYSGWKSWNIVQTSRKNGVRSGILACGGVAGTGYFMSNGRKSIAAGTPTLMRPGFDFPLPVGVCTGSTGQCQFNAILQCNAVGNWDTQRAFNMLVTALCKGYFVTTGGSSRSFTIGLNEQAVMNAPRGVDTHSTSHLVGGSLAGGGWQDFVGGVHQAINKGRRVWNTWKAAQPHVMSAINAGRDAWNQGEGSGLGGAIRRGGHM